MTLDAGDESIFGPRFLPSVSFKERAHVQGFIVYERII